VQATKKVRGRSRVQRAAGPDSGFTLVETLMAIVLVGTLAVAAMVTLRSTIIASRMDRDHANAHAWLQTASDVLYGEERVDCGSQAATDEAGVRAAYQAIIETTVNPEGWPPGNITIVPPVKFWDGVSAYGTVCYDDSGINLQLIKLEVRDPSGDIVESVEIVKG
jgi:prepilin-type N-terminal cleavage/methylation domain-containing protein